MQQIMATVVGVVLSGIGFLLARWIRRDGFTDTINRRLKVLALHQRMKTANIDLNELRELEKALGKTAIDVQPAQTHEKSSTSA
ncbi:MAG: hypothetical protein Devi2KO_01020 [Devosia indica]